MSAKVRKPAVAGLFYSDQKEQLQREAALYLESSWPVEIVKRVYGLIVPHAGYQYSGGVAARGYRQVVDREFDVVVVISPSHRVYFEEISVYDGDAYRTPLGDAKVDRELARLLEIQHPNIICSDLGHSNDEHALEVQIPFLQHVFEDFRFVPIVMGNQDRSNVDILASALAETLMDKKALIIASSDLSHFHSYDKAKLLDKVVEENISDYDEEKLFSDWQKGRCEMCGGGPAVVAMKACRMLGAKKSKILLYRNSGDVSGDRSQVVGYLAALLYE
jgi:AmmeMemoRadiSam system protein B